MVLIADAVSCSLVHERGVAGIECPDCGLAICFDCWLIPDVLTQWHESHSRVQPRHVPVEIYPRQPQCQLWGIKECSYVENADVTPTAHLPHPARPA